MTNTYAKEYTRVTGEHSRGEKKHALTGPFDDGACGIQPLLRLMVDRSASDMHLKTGRAPVIRVDGDLVGLDGLAPLSIQDTAAIFEELTTPQHREAFAADMELDFACSYSGIGRFRVNVIRDRGTLNLAIRAMPPRPPTIDELGLPQVLKALICRRDGLILVTGPSGSGKSTTMAAMIRHLNQCEPRSVLTIEDPVEYVYEEGLCTIAQRDVGNDTASFQAALVRALRHDPDVIVVGELRDVDAMKTALTAAETGHLVLGTLHTRDAADTISRVVHAFPHAHQANIRTQLAQVLEAVISQTLVRRMERGRVAAAEILLTSPAAKNIIRSGKIYELHDLMHSGRSSGMQTADQALAGLVLDGLIDMEEATRRSRNPEHFGELLRAIGSEGASLRQ